MSRGSSQMKHRLDNLPIISRNNSLKASQFTKPQGSERNFKINSISPIPTRRDVSNMAPSQAFQVIYESYDTGGNRDEDVDSQIVRAQSRITGIPENKAQSRFMQNAQNYVIKNRAEISESRKVKLSERKLRIRKKSHENSSKTGMSQYESNLQKRIPKFEQSPGRIERQQADLQQRMMATKKNGNFAEYSNVIHTESNTATAGGKANLDFIMKLRSKKSKREMEKLQIDDNYNSSPSTRQSLQRDYSEIHVPKVYYKKCGAQLRVEKKEYDYKGNFQDIRHLTKPSPDSIYDNSAALFATLLRQYDSPKSITLKAAKNKSKRSPNQKSHDSLSMRKDYDRNFSRNKQSILEQVGTTFLPPINQESIKHLQNVPVLRQYDDSHIMRAMVSADQNDHQGDVIHSFDPQNMAMPKYSSQYQETNAAAYRHLAGGTGKSSHLHWMMGLRHHKKSKRNEE